MSEARQLQAVSFISSVLYGVMFGVSFYQLLRQFSTRIFGIHKLFHLFNCIIYALRFLTWTSVTLGGLLILTTEDLFFQNFAYLFYFGTLALVSIYLLEKLALPFSQRIHNRLFRTCCLLFVVLGLAYLVLFTVIPESRTPQIVAREPEWMDICFVIHSSVGCCVFSAASVFIAGWRKVFGKHSKLREYTAKLRHIFIMMAITIVTLFSQLVTSIWSMVMKQNGERMNPYVKMAFIHWFPEAIPVGIIFLVIMHDHDTRLYAPLVIGFNNDPYDSHATTTSKEESEEVSFSQPPRAPSALPGEEETQKSLSAREYRAVVVSSKTPARLILIMTRKPDLSLEKCVKEVSTFHGIPTDSEIDRTELLENQENEESHIQFTKTLLIRDSEFSGNSFPIITAFSLRDPLNPECLGSQRVTLDNLVGRPIEFVPTEELFNEEKTRQKMERKVIPSSEQSPSASEDLNTRLLGADYGYAVSEDSDDSDGIRDSDKDGDMHEMNRLKHFATSGISSYPIMHHDKLTIVLERQGLVLVHPNSTKVGCCVRTFCMFGHIDGPAVRISVKQELWQSENAFSLPRQILEQIIDIRKSQLASAQEDLKHFTQKDDEGDDGGIEDDDDDDDDDEKEEVVSLSGPAGSINPDAGDKGTPNKRSRRQRFLAKVQYSGALRTMQDINTMSLLEKQYKSVVSCFAEHIAAMEHAIDAYSPEKLAWSFKSSVMKFNKEMRFAPTNLHTELMTVSTAKKTSPDVSVLPPVTYSFVTLGVPSAFVYKGLDEGARDLRQRISFLRKREEQTLLLKVVKKLTPASKEQKKKYEKDPSLDGFEIEAVNDIRTGEARVSNAMGQALLERRSVELLYIMRRDVIRSQVYAALAEAFIGELVCRFITVTESSPAASKTPYVDDEESSTPAFTPPASPTPSSTPIPVEQPSSESTATTTTTTSAAFSATDDHKRPHNTLTAFLDQVDACGFLVQFESLLSTRGNEKTMVGDYDDAVHMVRAVKLRFILNDRAKSLMPKVRISRYSTNKEYDLQEDEFSWTMDIICSRGIFNALPSRLKAGGLVDVISVIFTQGINEQQTMANILGQSALQDSVNRESYPYLHAYFQKYSEFVRSHGSPDETQKLQKLSKDLMAIAMVSNKRSLHISKNTELLPRVADFCRAINGGRCTSCKSGKDRTAMSVTWEEARILNLHHGLPEASKSAAMHAMRDAGVRRFNVVKNTGDCWYAFNPFQHQMLPEVYRAPRSSRSSLLITNIAT